MARTNTAPGTAPSAAHAATYPAPATGTAPAAGSPAAAVHAALTANPGSTIADIAGAAGTSKPATRGALLAMEKDGTATRVKGGAPGTPDTWTLAGTAPADGPHAAQPGADLPGIPGDGTGDEGAGGTGQDPAPEDDGEPGALTSPEAEAGPLDADDDSHEVAVAGEPAGEPAGEAMPGDPDEHDAPAGEDGADDAPDPAVVTDLIGQFDQIRAAADAAELVLTASGDMKIVVAGLEEIYALAAQARRVVKAAIGGRKAPAVRPGGLRDKVLAHLTGNPDGQFTPHEIHKVLDHSSGAIANALDTLVKLGQAEVATEKPRRFRLPAQPAAPAAPETAGADGTGQDGTELAGAA